jgi:hypothetical protein
MRAGFSPLFFVGFDGCLGFLRAHVRVLFLQEIGAGGEGRVQ